MSSKKSSAAFDVLSYSASNLAQALSNERIASAEAARLPFFYYLVRYFKEARLPAPKTLLIEKDYLNAAYLEEYAGFYATGFAPYSRYCKRVHFFSSDFDSDLFNAALYEEHKEAKTVWEGYLGYLVVKPLAHGRSGEALLKAPSGEGAQHPACRDYNVHVYGKTLAVCSLMFQQSDGLVVSNEAAAIWIALERASQLFKTPTLSLVEMARLAYVSIYEGRRLLPWTGPDMAALEKALAHSGLVVEYRNDLNLPERGNLLTGFIYGYLKIGLPVLMELKWKDSARRLIAITGFKERKKTNPEGDAIVLWSDNIDCLYAHDDEAGPFSVVQLGASSVRTQTAPAGKNKNPLRNELALSVMVALHPSIKAAFEDIYYWATLMDSLLKTKFSDVAFVWDIYLASGADFKSEVRSGVFHTKRLQYKIYTLPLPEYLWVARGKVDGMGVMELIFDAGAIQTSPDSCLLINVLDINFQLSLKAWLSNGAARKEIIQFFNGGFLTEKLFEESFAAYRSVADICLRFIKLWIETRESDSHLEWAEVNNQIVLLIERLKEIFKRRQAEGLFKRFEDNPAQLELLADLNRLMEAEMNEQPELAKILLNLLAAPKHQFPAAGSAERASGGGQEKLKTPTGKTDHSPIQLFEVDKIEKTQEKIMSEVSFLYDMLSNAGVGTEGDIRNQIRLKIKRCNELEADKQKILSGI